MYLLADCNWIRTCKPCSEISTQRTICHHHIHSQQGESTTSKEEYKVLVAQLSADGNVIGAAAAPTCSIVYLLNSSIVCFVMVSLFSQMNRWQYSLFDKFLVSKILLLSKITL